MKTLREVLFERHQAAERKLDAIREQVVAGLAQGTNAEAARGSRRMASSWHAAPVFPSGWRQLLWSLRWHLAGMGAAWVVAAVLSIDQAPVPAQGVTPRATLSPQQLLATLRENQRQLRELIETPTTEPAPAVPGLAPSPRSQSQHLSPASA